MLAGRYLDRINPVRKSDTIDPGDHGQGRNRQRKNCRPECDPEASRPHGFQYVVACTILLNSPEFTSGADMSITYKSTGVNIDAGNAFARSIKQGVAETHRPEVVGGIGGFGGMVSIPKKYKNPLLVLATDGVGTKLKLAGEHDRHSTIGQDLVAMSVNDVLCSGAEPLAFLDYFATGRLNPDLASLVVAGVADACKKAGCALLGGETAEMPGFYASGVYDLAGFCLGVVEREEALTPERVQAGDMLIGLLSDGPHSNGYSLIRAILDDAGEPPEDVLKEILAPTRIPAAAILAVRSLVSGVAHVTGGGLVDNVPRMVGEEFQATIEKAEWKRPASFDWLQRAGGLSEREMLRTFNCGIYFVIAARPKNAPKILQTLASHGERSMIIGSVHSREETVHQRSGQLLLSGGGGC